MTRSKLNKRAEKLGYAINGSVGEYWLDKIPMYHLDRRSAPYHALSEVYQQILLMEEEYRSKEKKYSRVILEKKANKLGYTIMGKYLRYDLVDMETDYYVSEQSFSMFVTLADVAEEIERIEN